MRLFWFFLALLASLIPFEAFPQGVTQPGVPYPVVNGNCLIGSGGVPVWGSCSGSGTAVTSVSGTSGQITVTPTTGATVVSLPTTITEGITWSGTNNFTGTFEVGGNQLGTFAFDNAATPPAIGGTTPAAGAFTTLSASSTVSGTGFSTYLASPPSIGSSAAGSGAFTTLSASSTVSGTGFSSYLASPPSIGSTAAASGAFTTLSASSTVSGTGFSTYLASPPAIGGTVAAAGSFTTLAATGALTTDITGSTQCVQANGSGVLSGTGSACGSGGGSGITVTDGTNTVTGTTDLTFGSGFVVGGSTPNATLSLKAPNRSVSSGAITLSSSDWGGQVNNTNASAPSATIPGTGTLGAGQSVILTNQAAAPMSITDSQTINGLPVSTAMHRFGWYGYTGNGASADAIGFPGYDTITGNAISMFSSDGSGAFTASEMSDASAGGVEIGSPTGGQKGAGTLNATGLYVNGTAVSTGGTVTSIATTSPITGGTITTTGTIACATCVTSAASLASGDIVTGSGGQASATDANASLSAGALSLGASGTLGSVVLGNATSGTLTVEPVTGALGTVTASLPANTGTIAELNLAQSWTASQRGTPSNVAISTATFTPNFNTAQNFEIDLTSACPCTLANPSTTLVAGQSGMIEVHQDATGSRTIGTWGADYQYAGGTSTITLSTAANAVDYISYYVNNAATGIVLGTILKAPAH